MSISFLQGNVFEKIMDIDDNSIDCVVTSPPYWGLRDYGTSQWKGGDLKCSHSYGRNTRGGLTQFQKNNKGSFGDEAIKTGEYCKLCGAKRIDKQLGLEPTYQEHIENIVELFRAMKPKLKDSATIWLNYGDSYAATVNGRSAEKTKDIGNDDRSFVNKPFSTIQGSLKPKDLVMIPNRIAIALQDDGWWIRSEIIWHKPNPMPESTKDRPTQCHEKIWLITKSKKYYYDADAVREPCQDETVRRMTLGNKGKVGKNKNSTGWKQLNNYWGSEQSVKDANKGRNRRNVWNVEEEQYRIISDKNRPEIIEYRDLPDHNKIREYLSASRTKNKITIDQIEKHFGNQAGHHWFEKNGSYPSKDDWLKLKKLLNFDDTYDKQLTTINIKSGLKQNHPLGKNKRNVWTITTKPCKEAHFATFPKDLIEPCIKAGCPEKVCTKCGKPQTKEIYREKKWQHKKSEKHTDKVSVKGNKNAFGQKYQKWLEENPPQIKVKPSCDCNADFKPGIVLDPFGGSGTTAIVAKSLNRQSILIELNPEYINIAKKRIDKELGLFS